MKLFRSLSFRLTLIYIGLFTASVLLLFGAYYWISIRMPYEAAADQVRREATALANLYMVDGDTALSQALGRRASAVGGRKPFHAFIAPGGQVVTANLPSWPHPGSNGWRRIEADIYREGDEDDYDALVLDRVFDNGARLLVGRDVEDVDEQEEALISALGWILGLAALLGVAGGLLMSLAIGRRIEAVASTVRGVMAGDLSERVPLRGSGDDFDQLAGTLNLMLGRIEGLVESVRRVSDSVAHELRTPLARLQAEVEELQSAPDTERAAVLARLSGEATRLQQIFDALLRIARIEGGRHSLEKSRVDVGALIADAAELYEPQAEAKGIRLTSQVGGQMIVEGDADLLFQAFANLVDNAIKFTPSDGTVTIELSGDDGEAILRVTDTGPGIAAKHLDRITERFYRAPEADKAEGSGLGLSLVAAVAEMHQSRLAFSSSGDGFKVEWRFRQICSDGSQSPA